MDATAAIGTDPARRATTADVPRRTDCPRCRYDLSGQVRTWDTPRPVAHAHAQLVSHTHPASFSDHAARSAEPAAHCPVHGTCPECGLDFLYRDVLNPSFRLPTTLLEHSRWPIPLPLARSLWLAMFRPRKLYDMVRMSHPIRHFSLALWSLVALVLWLLLLLGPASSIESLIAHIQNNVAVRVWYVGWLESITPGGRWWEDQGLELLALAIAVVFLTVGPVAVMLLMPVTLRRQKVRRAHLSRLAMHGLLCTLGWSAVISVINLLNDLFNPLLRLADALDELQWVTWELATFIADGLIGYINFTLVVAMLFAWVRCWRAGLAAYLKLRRTWDVLAAMSVITPLAALLALLAWFETLPFA